MLFFASDDFAAVTSSCCARPASGITTFDFRIGRRDRVRGGLMSLSLLILSEAVLPDTL
jgi:hypothetical protein